MRRPLALAALVAAAAASVATSPPYFTLDDAASFDVAVPPGGEQTFEVTLTAGPDVLPDEATSFEAELSITGAVDGELDVYLSADGEDQDSQVATPEHDLQVVAYRLLSECLGEDRCEATWTLRVAHVRGDAPVTGQLTAEGILTVEGTSLLPAGAGVEIAVVEIGEDG